MNQCVPNWGLDGSPPHHVLSSHSNYSNNSFIAADAPLMDYEVAELTWENGQIWMHGLGPPRVPNNKPLSNSSPTKYTWDHNKPRAGGTLESIVNQATGIPINNHPHRSAAVAAAVDGSGDDLVRWFDNCLAGSHAQDETAAAVPTTTAATTMAMDASMPTISTNNTRNSHQQEVAAPSARVASCSGMVNRSDGEMSRAKTEVAYEEIPKDHLYSMADQSVSQRGTIKTGETGLGPERLILTSVGSPENTSKHRRTSKTVDNHDSVCHSRDQREAGDEDEKKGSKISSVSTKRSRAAATHNQSERKRRDKINQRMKTLQKLVPTSSKTDKASMLDEVIEYLKQLQAQVQAMIRMNNVNMSPMMLPNMALQQQQLQMSMMASARAAMGMGMDVNALSCTNITAMPSVLHANTPSSFMPGPSSASVVPDPVASFLASQSQPMTVEAYSKMAALYQQYLQPHANLGFKN